MSEKINQNQETESANTEALEAAGQERQAELHEHHDASAAEKEQGRSHEQLADDAREKAHENEAASERDAVAPAEKRAKVKLPRKKAEAVNFKKTMSEAQSHMSAPSRTFSKLIHNKAVERTSEVAGSTVARPNALLAGSVSAFLLTLTVYLTAKYYGYPLSGFESIAAFIAGYIAGILFDYMRVMITGKKA